MFYKRLNHKIQIRNNIINKIDSILKRELARQTSLFLRNLADAAMSDGFPEIRVLTCIGGESLKNQIDTIRRYIHLSI